MNKKALFVPQCHENLLRMLRRLGLASSHLHTTPM